MATIRYTTRKNSDNSQSIYLIVNYGRKKQYRFNTKIRIPDIKYWNKETQTIKNVLAIPNSHALNSDLSKYLADTNLFLEECIREGTYITNEFLKIKLNEIVNNTYEFQKTIKIELLEFYSWFIEYYSNNPRPASKKPLAEGTQRVYLNSLELLKEYSNKVGGLRFKDITINFHQDYVSYLQNKSLSQNYIGTQIKNLKAVMNDAFDRDHHQNISFKKASFTKFTEQVNNIYLSLEELDKIINVDLKSRTKLEAARDLFLIGAFTGLRVCDYRSLTNENIKSSKGVKYLEVKTKKTSSNVVIPLSPQVLEILERNNGVPKSLSEQKINDYIKIIGSMASIDQIVEIHKTIGGKKVTKSYKKFELISNHTGRRSFCTNTYLSGMPVHNIMAMTGHKTEKSFYTYIKMQPQENIQNLANHNFFKG
ncbi:site-specific integrase [Croceibacter atlanticus]|uniref:site-specific integrase n=1 Tax=Croceibacter atlanticus TaxID=313588 RepID=UPI00249106DF|nr:site-specific integrase [Croceibacter atlanticus]